jgi:hypothetical protein
MKVHKHSLNGTRVICVYVCVCVCVYVCRQEKGSKGRATVIGVLWGLERAQKRM